MSTLEESFGIEQGLARHNAQQLGAMVGCIDVVYDLSERVLRAGDNVGKQSALSLGRLMVDACTHIQQAFLSILRGQPRMAWSALRVAAEATSHLHNIDREPELNGLWLAASRTGEPVEAAKAVKDFERRRKQLPWDDNSKLCREIVEMGALFGPHANSLSIEAFGPLQVSPEGVGDLPRRMQHPALLIAHVRALMDTGTRLLDILIRFRLKHLEGSAREELEFAADSAMKQMDAIAQGVVDAARGPR